MVRRVLARLDQAANYQNWFRGKTCRPKCVTPVLGSYGQTRGPAGFDEFFDYPGSHPEGTRRFEGVFQPVSVKATSVGDRVELLFEGLKLGIFDGGIAYTFYPGSR